MSKKVFFNFLFYFLVVLVIIACKQKKNPPKATTEVYQIQVPPSNFNLPVSYALKNLEAFLNEKITGKFLEKNITPLKNKKNIILLTLKKENDIHIKTDKQKLICILPINANAILLESQYGKIITNQVNPINTSLIVELETSVSINPNWYLSTNFSIKKITWLKDPVLKIAFIKYNLQERLNELLLQKATSLTKLLDEEIYKNVSLQSPISKIWFDIQKPILINRNTPQAWIRFYCNDIYGKLSLQKENIVCYTNVKATMYIITDTITDKKPYPLPAFKKLQTPIEESNINLYAYTSFAEINEQLNNNLKGKIFSAKGYTIAIKEINAYASTKGLSIKIITNKDVEGEFTASGNPVFNVASQTMRLENFDFVLNTNNGLLNTGEQLLHEMIRDTIAGKLSLQLDSLIKKVPSIVQNSIAKGKTGKSIDLKLKELNIKQCQIFLGKIKIHFKITAGVKANLRLKKLNAGKPLSIKNKKV
jgi:hypothetical protein